MRKFFDRNPYIDCFPLELFFRLKAGIDRTFLGEFTNDDEFIIFRMFATKIVSPINKSVTVDSKSIDEKH